MKDKREPVPDVITHPAVREPKRVTDWICPQSPILGRTHRVRMLARRCVFCGRSTQDLRAEQTRIMECQ